jgi:hypothetical protein
VEDFSARPSPLMRFVRQYRKHLMVQLVPGILAQDTTEKAMEQKTLLMNWGFWV